MHTGHWRASVRGVVFLIGRGVGGLHDVGGNAVGRAAAHRGDRGGRGKRLMCRNSIILVRPRAREEGEAAKLLHERNHNALEILGRVCQQAVKATEHRRHVGQIFALVSSLGSCPSRQTQAKFVRQFVP